ncbi:MAG TPA: hypothetical protein PKV71_12605 [Calditrichia bacterium]|nr:hypothetical protein [Calditrichota bacterium]HQV32716.1 hypothetical protein [Calditrichia bacterium]
MLLRKWYWGACCALFLSACAGNSFVQNQDKDFTDDVDRLMIRLQNEPENLRAMRDLGAYFFHLKQYDKAKYYLMDAYKRESKDPKILFYLGLLFEFEDQTENAMRLYQRFDQVSRFSEYRKLMQGRYYFLQRQLAKENAAKLARSEQAAPRTDANALAVFPFEYKGSNPDFEPLARGLSEMMIIDLGIIPDLKLVERVRIVELSKELALAQSGATDPTTSPRPGQLLGAGQVVGGILDVPSEDRLSVSMSYWDIAGNGNPTVTSKEEQLAELFRLQKEMVFEVVGKMGIQLTPEMRNKILTVPTKNIRAFLLYCQGLENEDNGQFRAAQDNFSTAIQLDGSFGMAREAGERVENTVDAAGSKEDIAAAAEEMIVKESGGQVGPQDNLLGNRFKTLNNSIGSNFRPGEDARKPLENAFDSGSGLGTLPEPPPPPQ